MPKIIIPSFYRSHVNNAASVFIEGCTISDSLKNLIKKYPSLNNQIIEGNTTIPHIKIFKESIDIDSLEGLNTLISDNETIQIIIPIAGG